MIPSAAVSGYSVCGIPVSSKVRKDVQTVPRRIKLSRAGMPCSNPFPQLTAGMIGLDYDDFPDFPSLHTIWKCLFKVYNALAGIVIFMTPSR